MIFTFWNASALGLNSFSLLLFSPIARKSCKRKYAKFWIIPLSGICAKNMHFIHTPHRAKASFGYFEIVSTFLCNFILFEMLMSFTKTAISNSITSGGEFEPASSFHSEVHIQLSKSDPIRQFQELALLPGIIGIVWLEDVISRVKTDYLFFIMVNSQKLDMFLTFQLSSVDPGSLKVGSSVDVGVVTMVGVEVEWLSWWCGSWLGGAMAIPAFDFEFRRCRCLACSSASNCKQEQKLISGSICWSNFPTQTPDWPKKL